MMSILGISALAVQLTFVPSWEKRFGLPNLNIVFLAIAAVTSLLTPFISYINGPTWLIWTCLIMTLGFNIIGWGIAFTAQIVLINDTAPRTLPGHESSSCSYPTLLQPPVSELRTAFRRLSRLLRE